MFFDSPKPRISKLEFHKAREILFGKGFTHQELSEVDEVFRVALEEKHNGYEGIGEHEFQSGIKWLRENIGHHRLSAEKVAILEEVLTKDI